MRSLNEKAGTLRIVGGLADDELYERIEHDLVRALESRGLSKDRARSYARELFRECAHETENEPWVSDDWFAQRSAHEIRSQGVLEDDLAWWLEKPELQRRVILKLNSIDREVAFLAELSRAGDWLEASRRVRARYPIIGDPDEDASLGLSRPIPPVLIKRVESLLRSIRVVPRHRATLNSVIRELLSLP